MLAAGRGERLRPLTDRLPKALVEVHGKSLLEHHLEKLGEAGIEDVVINLGWHGEQIKQRIGRGRAFGLRVAYSDEGENVLETGGGILKALPLLGADPFLVMNADIYTAMPVPDISLDEQALGHLVLVPSPAYRDAGDFVLVDGQVRNAPQATLTFAGVAVYRPELFAACKPGRFSVVPLLRQAADDGRLQGSLYKGLWADVGTPERLKAARAE